MTTDNGHGSRADAEHRRLSESFAHSNVRGTAQHPEGHIFYQVSFEGISQCQLLKRGTRIWNSGKLVNRWGDIPNNTNYRSFDCIFSWRGSFAFALVSFTADTSYMSCSILLDRKRWCKCDPGRRLDTGTFVMSTSRRDCGLGDRIISPKACCKSEVQASQSPYTKGLSSSVP